ncbi:MAG: YitT family protein [Acidobacteriota bacterium]
MAIIIISEQNVPIRERIMGDLGRGVTIYRGYGGMSGAEQSILYRVVTRLEIGKVKGIVREIDGAAFIVLHALAGAEGGLVKTRGFH